MSPTSSKTVLITGAASGIGAAVARAYAQKGIHLILLDKDIPGLEACYDAIINDNAQADVLLFPMDLSGATLGDYQQLIEHIDTEIGHLDGLIHCAALLGQLAPIVHQQPQQWVETLHVNLTAAFLLTQSCLPLIERSAGLIVFTTDSHQAQAYWSAYGISKAAIETLAKQLQQESQQQGRISVDCIDPGQARTPLYLQAFPGLDPDSLPSPDSVISPYLDALRHFEPTE